MTGFLGKIKYFQSVGGLKNRNLQALLLRAFGKHYWNSIYPRLSKGKGFRKLEPALFNFYAYANKMNRKDTISNFHKFYYDSGIFGKTWATTSWLGVSIGKCPLDLWIYQETIFDLRPDKIIECGTASGGSAFFIASMCDLVGKGEVVTIDIESSEGKPKHNRVKYLVGSSTSEGIVEKIKSFITDKDKVMVILDSDHHKGHVLDELRIYGKLVTKGSYLIVEDTNINGHPVYPEFGPGPKEAIEEFLKENKDFIVDGNKEKSYLTFNPGGYLRKVR